MYLEYIKERYPEEEELKPFTYEEVAKNFEIIQASQGALIFKTERGFITYCLKGDALIIFDIYVKPEFRRSNEARRMWAAITKLAQQVGKRVVIGLTEIVGNRVLGLMAMEKVEMVPAYRTADTQIFIKGI